MEVHAHTHTERKKWTQYFWEFLMLFLAVFCGFLAENFREHQVEHQREEKFAISLTEDLKKDKIALSREIPFWEGLLKKTDTARSEIEKPAGKRNVLLLYKSVSSMRAYSNFEYHDGTIEQLKNGGNFRLIRKSVVADSIIDYDALIKSQLRDQEVQSNNIYQTLNYLQDKFLNSKYSVMSFLNPGHADSIFEINPEVFAIAANKEEELFEYYNHLQFYYTITFYRLYTLKELQRRATNLIELLKKEYHLK
jgi:hypothetical protein